MMLTTCFLRAATLTLRFGYKSLMRSSRPPFLLAYERNFGKFTFKGHLKQTVIDLSEWRPPVAVLDETRGRRHRVHRGTRLYVHSVQGNTAITLWKKGISQTAVINYRVS